MTSLHPEAKDSFPRATEMLRNRLAAICGMLQIEIPLQSFEIEEKNAGSRWRNETLNTLRAIKTVPWSVTSPFNTGKVTKPTALQNPIPRKDAAKKVYIALYSLHTLFWRDYFKSEDLLVPRLLLDRQWHSNYEGNLWAIIDLISYGWNHSQIFKICLLQDWRPCHLQMILESV